MQNIFFSAKVYLLKKIVILHQQKNDNENIKKQQLVVA
jgi:hypothetical protein